MFIRKGIRLLEERVGDGEPVERQEHYVLSIRLTLNQGQVLDAPPWGSPPESGPSDGYFNWRVRIDRIQLIPGLFYTVDGMRVGGFRKVVISPHLAYGQEGIPGQIPANAKLIAEVKVLREVPYHRRQWPQDEISDTEMLTQFAVCKRYQINRLTLWRWRKAGRIPAPLVNGRTVRWRLLTLEQWEAEGRPHVARSLDGFCEQSARALARVRELMIGPLDRGEPVPAISSPAFKEAVRLRREMEAHGDDVIDLEMELALLIDEAGQWDGPPLDEFIKDRRAATRPYQANCISDTLDRILAEPECPKNDAG